MARITTNRWRPDTCECEIEYTFDADVEGEREHTLQTINACAIHEQVTLASLDTDRPTILLGTRTERPPAHDQEARYLAALDDNRLKNKVYAHAMDELKADLTFAIVDPDTGETVQREKAWAYEWVIDMDRKLTYSIKTNVAAGKLTALNARVTHARVESANQVTFAQKVQAVRDAKAAARK